MAIDWENLSDGELCNICISVRKFTHDIDDELFQICRKLLSYVQEECTRRSPVMRISMIEQKDTATAQESL